MPEILRAATAALALAVAVAGLVSVLRDRPPRWFDLVGGIVLEALALTLIGTAVTRMAGGYRPHEMVTFIGYLGAFAIIPPAGITLARMEPSKWGSMIVAVTGIVEAILVVRLQQVWTGIG